MLNQFAAYKDYLLNQFGKMYLYLKLYSNDVCFSVFEDFFGANIMLTHYLENEYSEKIMFDLIQTHKYELATEIATKIKYMAESELDGEKLHNSNCYKWTVILCTRQVAGTTLGQNYSDMNQLNNSESESSNDGSE